MIGHTIFMNILNQKINKGIFNIMNAGKTNTEIHTI